MLVDAGLQWSCCMQLCWASHSSPFKKALLQREQPELQQQVCNTENIIADDLIPSNKLILKDFFCWSTYHLPLPPESTIAFLMPFSVSCDFQLRLGGASFNIKFFFTYFIYLGKLKVSYWMLCMWLHCTQEALFLLSNKKLQTKGSEKTKLSPDISTEAAKGRKETEWAGRIQRNTFPSPDIRQWEAKREWETSLLRTQSGLAQLQVCYAFIPPSQTRNCSLHSLHFSSLTPPPFPNKSPNLSTHPNEHREVPIWID